MTADPLAALLAEMHRLVDVHRDDLDRALRDGAAWRLTLYVSGPNNVRPKAEKIGRPIVLDIEAQNV